MFQNYWAQDLAADQTAPGNQSALTYQVLDIEVFVFYHPPIAMRTVHGVLSRIAMMGMVRVAPPLSAAPLPSDRHAASVGNPLRRP